jgi:ferric enterobactin receptor
MKLEVTAGYISELKWSNSIVGIIVLLLFFEYNSYSQEYHINFSRGTTLSKALDESSRTYHFRVAYDASRLDAINVADEAWGNSIEEYLNSLLLNSGFGFSYKHGSYLIVDNYKDKADPKSRECQLMASVTDHETGEQLPFASILLPEQDIQAMASTNGTFSVKSVISNPLHIIIKYIGYHTLDTSILWSGSQVNMVFQLRQEISKINQVDIVQNKADVIEVKSDVDFATSVNPSRLIDMPAVVEADVFRTLQLLPGIRYSENSSELSIRGGTSDQNLVLFDGQTLYNLSHYYGVFSSVNPNIVKDIEVYKGGFDSRYGERIAGIVDITGKSGNQLKPAFQADINLLSINMALELPITKKLTVIMAGRRSYSDIYKTSFAGNLFDKFIPVRTGPGDTVTVSQPSFYFYDLNGKLSFRISNTENISLSLYGGKDHFENSYSLHSHGLYVSNTDSNVWHNYGISLNWQKQWNSSFFSNAVISYSGYDNSSSNLTNINSISPGGPGHEFLPDSQNIFRTQSHNTLKDLSLSLRNTYRVNDYNSLNFGLLMRQNGILYHKDADGIYVYDNTSQSSYISSVYIQNHISAFKNLVIKPGFRLTYYQGDQKMYFEPRLSANYSLNENFSLRLATGHYNQFISQVYSQQETGYSKNFWILANDSVNPVLKANHFIAGATFKSKKFQFDVEGYYKQYTGIQEYFYISQFLRNTDFKKYFPPQDPNQGEQLPLSAPSYFISGSGRSYGLDFFASYKTSHFESWISYSLSKNDQNFDHINNGSAMPALTDQRHQFSFTNLYTIGKWNLGSVFLFNTGRPYIVSTESQGNSFIERRFQRLPNYFRCDVSANYNFRIKLVRLKTGISVINLFNSRNYFDANTRKFDFENTTFSETNLIQSQKLSLNVFLHIAF